MKKWIKNNIIILMIWLIGIIFISIDIWIVLSLNIPFESVILTFPELIIMISIPFALMFILSLGYYKIGVTTK